MVSHIIFNGEFFNNGLGQRRMDQFSNSKAQILPSDSVNVILTCLNIFELSIPKSFIKDVVIPHTNKSMAKGHQKLAYGEFLVWISLCFKMVTIKGIQRHGFLNNITMDPFEIDPQRFNYILPQTHFKVILKALTITDETLPECKDPFWYVRQGVDVCN